MDQMALYGIKSVYLEIDFSVSKKTTGFTVTKTAYDRNYGAPAQPIQNAVLLKKIVDSGLESSLKTEAVRVFEQKLPQLLRQSGFERASGAGYEILFDDECMPVLSGIRVLADPDYTSIMMAARDNNLEKTRSLLSAGSNINAKDQQGRNAILEGTSHPEAAELVRMLVNAGANPNSADLIGETPLMQAAFCGDVETVSFLLQNRADITARNKDGADALQYALSTGEASLDVVRELIRAGADVNSKDHDGTTPLIQATLSALPGAVQELLAAGADPSMTDNRGYTALDHARSRTIERTKADDEIVTILTAACKRTTVKSVN
jgi:ankyrin repeat protein